jgi:hypothetical protein
MILYTNGTGHTAAAEAVNPYKRADEDARYWNLEGRPHPDNIKVSWGALLSSWLKMGFHTEARFNQTNGQIIENTKSWLSDKKPQDVFVILQWGNFETPQKDLEAITGFYEYLIGHNFTNFLFFNGDTSLVDISTDNRYNFSVSYLDPYLPEGCFSTWLNVHGYDTVITSNEHFGPDAHSAWAKHLLNYIIRAKLV